MDTYRVDQYNITSPGVIQNRLVQGSLRFQKLNLTSKGVLVVRDVGVQPTTDTTPVTELPGSFNSSSDEFNRIWYAGARTSQLTELPEESVPAFYQVSSEGTIAENQAPQVLGSVEASSLTTYSLDFTVKSSKGGFGFIVLADTLNNGIYISVDLDARKVAVYYGSTTLNTLLQEFALPPNASPALDSWHKVHAEVALTDISATMDGVSILRITQFSRFYGSFGFGASFGQRAIFRNVTALGPDGHVVYTHNLTDPSFLPDFFSGVQPHAAIVDGSRRDRIAYTGDLDVASGALLASTHNLEALVGSINLLGSYRTDVGFFIPTAKIQQEPLAAKLNVDITGLIGYSFNFLTAIAATYTHTGDLSFAKQWAPSVQSMLEWAHSQTLETTGLFNVSQASFGGDWNYYDPPQSGVVTKFNVVYAYALQECQRILTDGGVDATIYGARLDALRTAIDTHLWSDSLQAYYISDAIPDAFAQDANAIAILAGVNAKNASHSSDTILRSLDSLFVPAGPLAFSSAAIKSHGFAPYISPYASSYHLRAAFAANSSATVTKLLHHLWMPMADPQNANYTGAFWETLDQTGAPAFGTYTSLAHGWSAGPTAELSRYVLGASAVTPGWTEFVVKPLTVGLTNARGEVPTPRGAVRVKWSFDEGQQGLMRMVVEAPQGAQGKVYVPRPLVVDEAETVFVVNGEETTEPFEVEGGCNIVVEQVRRA